MDLEATTMEAPWLSIVTAAHNNPGQLTGFLTSVETYRLPGIEVWVVDDGSDPPLEDAVSRFDAGYHHQERSGPSRARNRGARLARGRALLFLDSDTELMEDTLIKVRDIVDRPDFEVVTLMYHPRSLNMGWAPRFKGLFDAYVWLSRPEGPAPEFQGQCGLIRRDIFLDLGGWDEGFDIPDMEHEEFSKRIKNRHAIMFHHGLYVKHNFPGPGKLLSSLFLRSMSWTRLRMNGRVGHNDQRYSTWQALSALTALSAILTALFGLVHRYVLGLSVLSLLLYAAINLPFFAYLYRHGGPLAGTIYIAHHFLVSFVVGAGAVIGGLTSWKAKVR